MSAEAGRRGVRRWREKMCAMELREHQRWWEERGAVELRELLFYEWDPIGLRKLADAPLDEYDHYAGQLVRRLRAGATDGEVALVLSDFRHDMGLEADDPPLGVARRIRDWYSRSTSAWLAAGNG